MARVFVEECGCTYTDHFGQLSQELCAFHQAEEDAWDAQNEQKWFEGRD